MTLVDITVLLLTIFISCFTYFKWKYMYWRKKNIPFIEPHIPFGTIGNPFTRTKNVAILIQEQYQRLKTQGYKYGGMYYVVKPLFLPVDIEVIKHILSKDFQYFTDRGSYYNEEADPLSANLFNLEGPRWRNLRTKLTPTFTSGKIRMMFPTLIACGDPMLAALSRQNTVDIKDILARFTTDVIGSCAFGLDCNSFKEPESDFRKYGKRILTFGSKLQLIRTLLIFTTPKLAKYFRVSLVPPEPKQFFLEVVKNTVEYRRINKVERNDFIQLLMGLMEADNNGDGLTIEQITAQAFIFWFAGFETSSTTMAYCLYELAVNQDIQKRLREEICKVSNKHKGDITYEAVAEMKYLNQVVDETLRKYPPGPATPRICVQDYQLPDTDIVLEKGTRITIPIYALHHDSEYFPNPEKFNPERFSDENKPDILPFTYMPFGEGPRNCIGLRFGLLQTKVGLVILLKNFKFLLNSKTRSPLEFDRYNFVLTALGGIWLDIEKLPNDAV